MRIYTNERLAQRNAKIGTWSTLTALAIWGAAAYVSFNMPQMVLLSGAGLFLGFIVSQVGIYFLNHWGRKPRVDEQLNASLKGLPRDYSIYHFLTATSHLMVGPAGIWTILPYYQRGTITFEKNRWRQRGGGLMLAYLKLFAQEDLGRPDHDVLAEVDNVKRYIQDKLGDSEIPPVNAVLVFTHPQADLQAEGAPIPTLKAKYLKDFMRKYAKEHPFPIEEIKRITDVLPQPEE
jgi:hypothetical protein